MSSVHGRYVYSSQWFSCEVNVGLHRSGAQLKGFGDDVTTIHSIEATMTTTTAANGTTTSEHSNVKHSGSRMTNKHSSQESNEARMSA